VRRKGKKPSGMKRKKNKCEEKERSICEENEKNAKFVDVCVIESL